MTDNKEVPFDPEKPITKAGPGVFKHVGTGEDVPKWVSFRGTAYQTGVEVEVDDPVIARHLRAHGGFVEVV